MLHGRVVRPRGQGAVTAQDFTPLSVSLASIAHIPNAKVWQMGKFVGVTAPKEYDAIQAAAQLKVTWSSDPRLPGTGNFWENGRKQGDAGPAKLSTNTGNAIAALATSAHTVSATYQYPFNGHMSIGPTCAVADVTPNGITIFCNAQSITGVPTGIASMAINGTLIFGGIPAANVRAIFYEGSSSYGSNPTADVYQAAAILSKLSGAPVRLQYMRWDEHGYDNYGPATMYDVTGGVDSSGNITALNWTSYTGGGASVTPTTEAIGSSAYAAAQPSGAASTSDTIYKVSTATGNKMLTTKSFSTYNGYLRNSSLRAPGAQQSHFAGEQIVDELAHAANMDPVAFRVQNIDGTTVTGARWLAALNAVTGPLGANWVPKVSNSVKQTGTVRTGRGFGFGTFASTQVAMVADVSVNIQTGKFVATHLYIAQNTGFSVSPGLLANQITGSAIMGLSRAMCEEITFSTERVTSLDWVTYPLLRFADSPAVTVIVVAPNGQSIAVTPGAETTFVAQNTNAIAQGWTSSGSGEPASVPPGSAMANAFFDATGARLRQAPMTAARVRATLKAAGIS
jgi:CO/xanthine dehydrogenase Mo-binding subunit